MVIAWHYLFMHFTNLTIEWNFFLYNYSSLILATLYELIFWWQPRIRQMIVSLIFCVSVNFMDKFSSNYHKKKRWRLTMFYKYDERASLRRIHLSEVFFTLHGYIGSGCHNGLNPITSNTTTMNTDSGSWRRSTIFVEDDVLNNLSLMNRWPRL